MPAFDRRIDEIREEIDAMTVKYHITLTTASRAPFESFKLALLSHYGNIGDVDEGTRKLGEEDEHFGAIISASVVTTNPVASIVAHELNKFLESVRIEYLSLVVENSVTRLLYDGTYKVDGARDLGPYRT